MVVNQVGKCVINFPSVLLLVFLQVHYTFNKILMLQEPLLVVGAFYILFFTVILYVRLDFSITKVSQYSFERRRRSLFHRIIFYLGIRVFALILLYWTCFFICKLEVSIQAVRCKANI